MAHKYTGPGRIDDSSWVDQSESDPPFIAVLWNYDVEGVYPKSQHIAWLNKTAIPFLKKHQDWHIAIQGNASRTGPAAYNLALSKQRVNVIEYFLKHHGIKKDRFGTLAGDGAEFSNPQELEDDRDRAVTISVWPDKMIFLKHTRCFRIREVEDQMDIVGDQEHIFEIHQDLNNYSALFHFKTRGSPDFLHHHAMDDPKLLMNQDLNGPWNPFHSTNEGTVLSFTSLPATIAYPGGSTVTVQMTINDPGGLGVMTFPMRLQYAPGPEAGTALGTLRLLDREKRGTFAKP